MAAKSKKLGGCILISDKIGLIYVEGKHPYFLKFWQYYQTKPIFEEVRDRINKENEKIKFEDNIILIPIFPNGKLEDWLNGRNSLVSRILVEKAKEMIKRGSVAMFDYEDILNTEETTIPLIELNKIIRHKLEADGFFIKSYTIEKISEITRCLNCNIKVSENGDISKIVEFITSRKYKKEFVCAKCGYELNSMLLIARNIMRDIKKKSEKTKKTKLSLEEENYRRELYEEGFTDIQIANKRNISESAIYAWRRSRNLPSNKIK